MSKDIDPILIKAACSGSCFISKSKPSLEERVTCLEKKLIELERKLKRKKKNEA